MGPERNEQRGEAKKFGTIEVEMTLDGRIRRINQLDLEAGDKIMIVQRHQRPAPFAKEDLLKSQPEGMEDIGNMDFVYDPSSNEATASKEENVLAECKKVFGDIELIGTTPRRRGSEHKALLQSEFAGAKNDPQIDQLLDDSGLGLLGESFYGGFKYASEEAKFFKPGLRKPLAFGRSKPSGGKEPFSYMETWVHTGYLPDGSKWKTENPEDMVHKMEKLPELNTAEKSYFITHEANCVALHMIAERSQEEIQMLFGTLIDLPAELRAKAADELLQAHNFFDLYLVIKKLCFEHQMRGIHPNKILTDFLEHIKLTSGEGSKGYGAVSIYVARNNDEKGRGEFFEAAYDQQV